MVFTHQCRRVRCSASEKDLGALSDSSAKQNSILQVDNYKNRVETTRKKMLRIGVDASPGVISRLCFKVADECLTNRNETDRWMKVVLSDCSVSVEHRRAARHSSLHG